MIEISSDEGIERARSRVRVRQLTPARAWRIRRIDQSNKGYYLIVFGDTQAAIAVAAVDTVSGEVMTWAALPGTGPHLSILANEAVQKAALPGSARAELVWMPCRASLSPLYPVWEVRSGTKTVYVDQQGVVWKALGSAGPGG